MPCNGEYLNPNEREQQSQLAAELLIYVLELRGKKVTKELHKTADSIYGNVDMLDRHVATLCAEVRDMSEEEMDTIVYDGRNATARKLAAWWERHEEADRAREAEERKVAKRKRLAEQARGKLTDEELAALIEDIEG